MEGGLMQRAGELGGVLLAGLRSLAERHRGLVREVRGKGLMAGLELDRDAEPCVAAMRDRGILINGTDRTVLRFLPPLIVDEGHIALTIDTLDDVLDSLK
jgi:acetylornithine/succinyldiaminopimelate/putrescine aminotransferase